ncbi:RNA polymerase sigma factor [Flavivirga spongiicola]|uniref:RNA polymerase sigma-70 factor n=1 Tax=Flavivirga spongiicola TaxID=421621 RepID=A0ABU7XVW8_9FLAO|nr:RNA polymerase sigma-70 factor [Flavivirga sp. MEBiC05379]MDO5979080.1 RNA polymerase sigma-70 factor [Flavivirga sp. MEBiC05379]
MNFISDDEILQILKKGDEKSISILHEKYSEELFISAYNMLKNKEICEDILQEVFINIWNKRGHLNIKTSLKSYLYASVMYGVYGYYRKNSDKMNVELLEGFNTHVQQSNPETKLIQREIIAQINSIIESLPEKCRLVFEMSRNEQLSHKEIAEKLNISTKTIETHITKALKAIRSSLGHTYSIEIVAFLYHIMTI